MDNGGGGWVGGGLGVSLSSQSRDRGEKVAAKETPRLGKKRKSFQGGEEYL